MMFGTVGVAPGSYTIRLGGGGLGDPQCPPDEISTGEWGVPMIGWYDPNFTVAQMQAGVAPLSTSGAGGSPEMLNPYGTESRLQGLRDTQASCVATCAQNLDTSSPTYTNCVNDCSAAGSTIFGLSTITMTEIVIAGLALFGIALIAYKPDKKRARSR